jgi:hypothetical protein
VSAPSFNPGLLVSAPVSVCHVRGVVAGSMFGGGVVAGSMFGGGVVADIIQAGLSILGCRHVTNRMRWGVVP